MVSVTDGRIQLGQVVTLLVDDLGGGHDPGAEDISIHGNLLAREDSIS